MRKKPIEQLKTELLLSGKDVLVPLMENLLNSALKGEMDRLLEGDERKFGNSRNGHMSKQMQTSMSDVIINTFYGHDGIFDPRLFARERNPYRLVCRVYPIVWIDTVYCKVMGEKNRPARCHL